VAWLELTLRLPVEALPRAEALLELAGATSVTITDAGDKPILEPAPGTTPLWAETVVRALFPDSFEADALTALLKPLDAGISIAPLTEDELAAAEAISPEDIGPRLAIVPAEMLPTDDPRAIGLHMGLAFGTGRHPTTRLCLEWIERHIAGGETVLDYGAGTGVLALAALKLGASSAMAIDNEPQALQATRRNAELNGLTARVRVAPPEDLGAETFDLILANILAGPLQELEPAFAAHQQAGARIVLSGILDSQANDVEAAFSTDYGNFERRTLDGWAVLTATRNNGYDR